MFDVREEKEARDKTIRANEEKEGPAMFAHSDCIYLFGVY